MAAKNSAARKTAQQDLVVTRVFDAPRSLVYQSWIEPERVAQWWGPRDFTITFCEMDARPGGAWRVCMRAPDGGEHWVRGVYRELVAPERLAFTWAWEDVEGKPGHETLVVVSLVGQGAKTALTLRQSIFESDTARDAHQSGWTECMDRFAAYLAQA